ncbi:uncharacterized protein [Epargyreus clarus]|uniref:uncharacterized protein isoform X1 n=1 Tax=Epargyreus clarus TaxID=520877 RepID=UPI003C30E2BD
MPTCAVKWCKHSTESKKKRGEVSFHSFPKNILLNDKWEAAIQLSHNEPHWQATSWSVVCSDHFDETDLYVTKCGVRRVTRNGYPTKNLTMTPSIIHGNSATFPGTSTMVFVNPVLPNKPTGNNCGTLPTISYTEVQNLTMTPSIIQGNSATFPGTSTMVLVNSVLPNEPTGNNCVTLQVQNSLGKPKPNDSTVIDTPRKKRLRDRLMKQAIHLGKKRKQVKTLQKQVRRLKNWNLSLIKMIYKLKSANFIDTDLYSSLNENIVKINLFNI